ncbi:universal stress protein [Polaromonas sp.]|uniref:universal stress protein n=1 Tax=Polaromonas sp. TaxID=1869339 RepID=UPI003BA9CCCA
MFSNILVPFDGSSTAENALHVAIGLADRKATKLTLLYILNEYAAIGEMQMASPSLYLTHMEGLRRHGNEVLEEARIIAASAGIEARVILCETRVRRAADAICEEAAKGYDAVIMGTHGRRGLQKLMLGSDAERVSRACTIPVLLVPQVSTPYAIDSPFESMAQHLEAARIRARIPDDAPRVLPKPRMKGGMPLLSALKLRRSVRTFQSRPLQPQILSDLLWAAFGINRPGDNRTAPYWRHVKVIEIYVTTAEGTWVYEPARHRLLPCSTEDLRDRTGTQDFVDLAPVNLVYVAHGERMTNLSMQDQRIYAGVDAAFIGQNVYLFCASEGLACVFRGALDPVMLARTLNLPEGQFVTFAQTVGFAPM